MGTGPSADLSYVFHCIELLITPHNRSLDVFDHLNLGRIAIGH